LGDGEGCFLTGEIVSGAAEFLDVGADAGIAVQAGGGAMGGFAFGGVIAGEEIGFGGGAAFGELFGEDFLATAEGWCFHGTCLYIIGEQMSICIDGLGVGLG
jgi:hypothetical protein